MLCRSIVHRDPDWIAMLVTFIITCAAVPALADSPPQPLKIATWNLEWFFDDDTRNNRSEIAIEQSAPSREVWEWKLHTTAGAISRFQPTILAVQEIEDRQVLQSLIKVLKERHGLTYRAAFIEGFDNGTEQDVGILYQSGLVEYSRREQTKEMFSSNEFYNLSKHLFARFEWQIEGRTESFILLNMHLRATAEAAELRRRQCKLARRWIESDLKNGIPVIVLGDLNIEELAGHSTEAGDGSYQLLGRETKSTEDDLQDLLDTVPEKERQTHLLLPKQFDRIFVSRHFTKSTEHGIQFRSLEVLKDINIRGVGVDVDHWENRFSTDPTERDISDHHPVMATFDFR